MNVTHTSALSWERYKYSLQYLGCGSSTLSKVPHYENIEPAQIVKGKGCRIWDTDGNEYIDFRNALGPVTLGYGVPEIDEAIIEQLKNGIIFGHQHQLESEVAELLAKNIPCAEKVRFLKTGGEAIAACIKIARAASGRNAIIQCGYNGWLNNLASGNNVPSGIASSQPALGVPASISKLHKSLPWGNENAWKEAFEENGSEIAAVIIACSYAEMEVGRQFLPFIRELTRKHQALMIMDEIVTGFRLAVGGAHEYFGINPDMAVFAKGLANGMPLAAYLGKAELIELSGKIGISSTYGGETLSLAAAKAAINYYKINNVTGHFWKAGNSIWSMVNGLFKTHEISITIKGLPPCPIFMSDSVELLAEFFKNCYRHGVSLYNVPYVNYSHKAKDLEEAVKRIEQAILELKKTFTLVGI
jgi:glutamate-1-semialdehyde 2,1-aminomutase